MMTQNYMIKGMTCGGCVAKVRNELLKIPEVLGAEVKPDLRQAEINMKQTVPLSILQAALSRAGNFSISPADPEELPRTALQNPGGASESGWVYKPLFITALFISLISLI